MTSGRADIQRRSAIWYLETYCPGITSFEYQMSVFDSRLMKAKVPEEQQLKIFSRAMPRIDLFVERATSVDIVEIKTSPKLKDVAELGFYKDALDHDITRPHLKNLQKILIFLTVDDHTGVETYCKEANIRYIYVPEHELPPPDKLYLGKL